MTTTMKADSLFQIFIKDFADDFGIQNPAELETQKREIIPEALEIDTVVSFPDDFDFTTLQDRIFPFWGKENVIEYKAKNDRLAPMYVYKYGWAELGIIASYLLSKKREDRKERQPLSQEACIAQWKRLQAQSAQHSCCNTILSTTDPVGIRKICGFEPVDTYEHLSGALYRQIISEDEFVGSAAIYLVVLNDLSMHPKNAPLLLLSTGAKLTEFCEWLLETHEGLTLRQQQHYLSYIVGYQLVQDKEMIYRMSNKMRIDRDHVNFLADFMSGWPLEYKKQLIQRFTEMDSPIGVAQAALQADSPEEAALEFIQTEEQMERLLELARQRNLTRSEL